MAPNHLLAFDIETIPDRDHHEGDGFPKPPFHKVVAIGFLHAEIERQGAHEAARLGSRFKVEVPTWSTQGCFLPISDI
jgi:hypothetical protein